MTESMRPPILKPDINVPVTLTVPFGDYKELEGQYGTQFMYNVQVDGETQTLFADVKLHQAMLTAGLAPGVTMTITKTQESFETAAGEQRRANVWLISGGSGTPTAATALAVPAPTAAPTPTPPAGNAREVWVAQVHHFKRCIAQAEKAYTDLGYTVDKSSPDSINSAAATLFIQSSKTLDIAALSSPPEPPPAPAPTPPPTPPTPVLQGGGAGGAADYNDDLPFAPAF
jgi:hypothetical protein